MTTQELTPELVRSLQESTREILETMVFVTPTGMNEEPETRSSFEDEVVGVLSFTGTRCGTVCIRTDETVAKTIAAKMLMMEPGDFGSFAEAADGFGELVNMVCGNFKNAWVAQGNQMDLSVPTVIHRGRVSLKSDAAGAVRSCVRVALPFGEMRVGVHFEAK